MAWLVSYVYKRPSHPGRQGTFFLLVEEEDIGAWAVRQYRERGLVMLNARPASASAIAAWKEKP